MAAPNGERRLRRWAAALIAVLGLLLVGTWTTVRLTTNHLLEREAAAGARNWAEFLAANIGDLEQIAAGEQPVAASMAFFEIARKSGQVFRYVIFNRDGYSQLVSDRERIALVDLSEFSLQAAHAMNSGNPHIDSARPTRRRSRPTTPPPMCRCGPATGRSRWSPPTWTRPSNAGCSSRPSSPRRPPCAR